MMLTYAFNIILTPNNSYNCQVTITVCIQAQTIIRFVSVKILLLLTITYIIQCKHIPTGRESVSRLAKLRTAFCLRRDRVLVTRCCVCWSKTGVTRLATVDTHHPGSGPRGTYCPSDSGLPNKQKKTKRYYDNNINRNNGSVRNRNKHSGHCKFLICDFKNLTFLT